MSSHGKDTAAPSISIVRENGPASLPKPSRSSGRKRGTATSGKSAKSRAIRSGVSRPSSSAVYLGAVLAAILIVSLAHLSEGIAIRTDWPAWQCWSYAVGVDAMLVAVSYAVLTASDDIRRQIHYPAAILEITTLVMSGYLNTVAAAHGGPVTAEAAAIGCFIPFAICLASYILAKLR